MELYNLMKILDEMMVYMQEQNLPSSLPDEDESIDKTHITGWCNREITIKLHPGFVGMTNGLEAIADSFLISQDGKPNFAAHRDLENFSEGKYYITPGETDSFGWLTGIIHTPRGKFVYG